MEIPVTQLPPGDPRLVEAIVGQLKSKGIFDQFRKECLADVDTKPAFQNLRQRVEGHVNKFLEKKTWKNDMNKNQLRDGVRKHVNNLGILDSGIDAIITQVVNPKIKPLILPYVEDTVYAFLQIDKPKRERRTSVEPHVSPVPPEEEPEPKPVEVVEEKKPSLLPMETDVISSEEDDILARESPEAASKSSSSSEEEEIKTLDENAQDGFESCPPRQEDSPDGIVSTVERLQLSEDDSKSTQAAKPSLPLFEDQSLDSISSNSSGLTFSPLTVKGSPESKKSHDDATKSDDSPRTEMRSATSTPLVDEKPVDESSQSSLGSHHSKEFQPSEKAYPGGDSMLQVGPEISPPSLSALPSSARSGKDGTSLMSFDEDSLESKGSSKISVASVKSETEEKAKSEKSEGEITSSSSEFSDGDTKGKQDHMSSEGKQHSNLDSSHKSNRSKSDYKKRRDSQSRDRDREREKEKDSRHHRDKERKHSKSRDDHHSHRDKDKKHHRRDKDHDGDRERSRSHHHQSSSSSHKEGSGSKDKDRSSHHSSGKSSEGKSRSNHSNDKSDGKTSNKSENKSDERSEGKSHKKDDRKADSKSESKREKRSEERIDRRSDKSDKKSEKKERSVEKQTRKPESNSQESKMEDKLEEKKVKTKEETESKSENRGKSSKPGYESSPRQKKHEGNVDVDSKKRKRIQRYEEDAEMLLDDIPKENNKHIMENDKNGMCETLREECQIDAHMLGLSGDNIIVADDEGNFMLLTYEDDTDSTSSSSQMAGRLNDCSLLEMPMETVKEDEDCSMDFEGFDNDFEGFENADANVKLTNHLRKVVRVPDEMDLEYSEWFDESDLHMTLYEGTWDQKIPMSDFLNCMHRLGAVVRNEKGEIEDHSTSGVTPIAPDLKENNNIHPLGKRRRISNSSSVSSSSSSTGSPKHKRFRRESSAASDTSQMLEQDAVIVSGYALLTPEDDGNRSMSREYDLDYSQKIPNYRPLSPASDSSADEGKAKNRGTVVDASGNIVKPSAKVDQKTDTSWPSKEVKFSV